jgi:hypothetical protein
MHKKSAKCDYKGSTVTENKFVAAKQLPAPHISVIEEPEPEISLVPEPVVL